MEIIFLKGIQIYCVYVLYMYLLDVSIRDLKYFCVLFGLFVFLFMLLALLRCYTSIFDGFIVVVVQLVVEPVVWLWGQLC